MLTILHTESSLAWGGQEIRIIQESQGMIKKGHRVLVAASEESLIYGKAQDQGIPAFPIQFKKGNPLALFQVLRLIERERVDIVNTHSSYDSWIATIAAKLCRGRPRILRTRHLSTPISRSFLSRLIYDVLPDLVITTGAAIKEQMVQVNGFRPEKIISIPTGVALDRFNPRKVAPAFPWDGFFRVGTIGVLRHWKGHNYLLEAVPLIIEAIPAARFYIVGAGPGYRRLERQIAQMQLRERVFLLGHREDIPEILASLDVVVHPSTGNEGVPQSVLQAQAMEKPVVAADAGSIKEVIIDGETGFLISARSPEEIAARVIELCQHRELGARLGKAGRKLVKENFTVEKMLDNIETIYQRLAGKR
jgi:glycosyltransferase involved in cell wall biosynthesis